LTEASVKRPSTQISYSRIFFSEFHNYCIHGPPLAIKLIVLKRRFVRKFTTTFSKKLEEVECPFDTAGKTRGAHTEIISFS
jgi:hypothetical protein